MKEDDQEFENQIQQFQYVSANYFTSFFNSISSKPKRNNILKHIDIQKSKRKTRTRKHQSDAAISKTIQYNAQFNFNFQSGCLGEVTNLENNNYLITIKNQTNSKKPCQWFYFSCSGIFNATFVIVGFTKTKSLFNKGMKISVKQDGKQWKKGCDVISYEQQEQLNQNYKSFRYKLKFSYKFEKHHCLTYFASTIPYTYSKLQKFLKQTVKKHKNDCQLQTITKTYQNNNVYCLTIGNLKAQQTIVISARVHPGETVSSFIVQGFIKQLLQNHSYSNFLRSVYQFKIFPMLNPDGVKSGNYRLSFTGCDLNRTWQAPNKFVPEILHLKKYLLNLNKTSKILIIIDIHGHSRQKNVFFYGCNSKSRTNDQKVFRQFPFLMSKIQKSYCYQNCSFKMSKGKGGTMRQTMYDQLNIPLIYTLQCSLSGNQKESNDYSTQDLNNIGNKLVQGIAIYFPKKYLQYKSVVKQLMMKKKSILMNFQYLEQQNIDNDSDSNPSQGCFNDILLDQLLFAKQKKKSKTVLNTRQKTTKQHNRKFSSKRLTSFEEIVNHTSIDSTKCKDVIIRSRKLQTSTMISRKKQQKPSHILKVKEAKLMQQGLSIELQLRNNKPKTYEGLNLISRPYQTKKIIKPEYLSSIRYKSFMIGPQLGCRKIQY